MKELIQRADIVSLRFMRFCIVGTGNVLADFLCYSLLLSLAFSPYLARTASWITACLFSYSVNRRWTFKAGDTGLAPLARFFVINACSLGLGLLLLYVFKNMGFGNKVALILTLPFTMASNYLGYRFWTFRNVDAKT